MLICCLGATGRMCYNPLANVQLFAQRARLTDVVVAAVENLSCASQRSLLVIAVLFLGLAHRMQRELVKPADSSSSTSSNNHRRALWILQPLV